MNIEVVTRRDEIDALAQRWDQLANTDPRDAFFRTFEWYRSWVDHIRPEAEPFVVVARTANNHIAGLAPLCRLKLKDHWLPIDAVSFGGREVVSGDYLDWLVVPELRSQVLPQMLNFIWQQRSKWGLLVLGEIFKNNDLHDAIREFSAIRGLRIRQQEERVCPCIELPSTFEGYLANGFSQKRRKEIKRQLRVILEDFGAVIEVFHGSSEVCRNLDTLMSLHTERWHSANQTGNMVRPGFREFVQHICDSPPGGSSPRLLVMKHAGKAVASLLMFHSGQSALAYSIGRDPACAMSHLSPGYALLVHSIRDAIEQGMRYYDFLRGDERHKTHLTRASRKTVTILVANSFSANMYLRALDAKDAVKQRFPALWKRLVADSSQRLPGSGRGEDAPAMGVETGATA